MSEVVAYLDVIERDLMAMIFKVREYRQQLAETLDIPIDDLLE